VGPLIAALLATSTAADDYSNLQVSLTRHTLERYVADLDEVKKKGVLRVLTRNNSEDYFIARGEERGFQFELARELAKKLGVRIAFVVPPSRDGLINALLEGEGDLIASGLTISPARAEKVRLSRAVLESQRVVVTHPLAVKTIATVEDLAQVRIAVSFRSTTYRDALDLQRRSGVKLALADVDDGVEMEEMMQRVADGKYEATIADSNLVDLSRAMGVEVIGRLPIGEPHQKAWAVHPAAPKLAETVDAFIAESKKSGLINIFYARYYETASKWVKKAHDDDLRTDVAGTISPYDRMFKKAGADTGLDWRLLAAVAYTESRFDAKAKSDWGAVGLMQVLPSTAKSVGVAGRLEDPFNNIMAGARYLKRLVALFEKEEIAQRQRIRFAVAAYNAGIGHILDARTLAKQTGRDPNRWFHSVEEAILLKADRKWHEKTKFGFCRAAETVGYVSAVQSRYDVFARHVKSQ
jgi:membrane-bound lytic murein transglycosylase F